MRKKSTKELSQTVEKVKKERKKLAKLDFKDLKSNKMFIGVLCLAVSGIISFVVLPATTALVSRSTTVIMLKEDVKKGDVITNSMITESKVGGYNIADNVIKNKSDALGKVASFDMQENDILTESKLQETLISGESYLSDFSDGRVYLSVKLENLEHSLSSKIHAGDIVTIYATNSDTKTEALSYPELKYVEVVSVTNEESHDLPNDILEDTIISTAVLRVYDEQARILSALNENSTLHLALASRDDNQMKEALLNAQEQYIFGEEILDNEQTD